MIAEGEEFEAFIRRDLFAQRVIDFSHDGHLMKLYAAVEKQEEADVFFCHDYGWRLSEQALGDMFDQVQTKRAVISERLLTHNLFAYTKISAEHGFRLHRCNFIHSPDGDIAVIEFHRKEP